MTNSSNAHFDKISQYDNMNLSIFRSLFSLFRPLQNLFDKVAWAVLHLGVDFADILAHYAKP